MSAVYIAKGRSVKLQKFLCLQRCQAGIVEEEAEHAAADRKSEPSAVLSSSDEVVDEAEADAPESRSGRTCEKIILRHETAQSRRKLNLRAEQRTMDDFGDARKQKKEEEEGEEKEKQEQAKKLSFRLEERFFVERKERMTDLFRLRTMTAKPSLGEKIVEDRRTIACETAVRMLENS